MAKKKSVVVAQKMPKKNKSKAIWDLVLADIKERDKNGKEKYGVRLQAFNGRNSVVDAYQEVLDLTVYFRQLIEERETLLKFLKAVQSMQQFSHQDLVDTAGKLLQQLGENE